MIGVCLVMTYEFMYQLTILPNSLSFWIGMLGYRGEWGHCPKLVGIRA